MAGSYAHICNEDHSFQMDLIENMGDAHEALEECHEIIAKLEIILTSIANNKKGSGAALAALGYIRERRGTEEIYDRTS